jgi:hypothetical protein
MLTALCAQRMRRHMRSLLTLERLVEGKIEAVGRVTRSAADALSRLDDLKQRVRCKRAVLP